MEDWKPPDDRHQGHRSAGAGPPLHRGARGPAASRAAGFVTKEIAPARRGVGGGARVPARAVHRAAASSASSASSTRRATAARAATTSTTPSGSRSWRARAPAAASPPGLGAHSEIATPPIWKFGTEEQKQRWLVPAIKGETIGALGITEPGARLRRRLAQDHRAKKVDGGYVVNGSKTFITNGVRADFLVSAVKTSEEGGHGGISFLVLEREMPGYEVTGKLEKMGWHSSDTGELSFTDVEVPDENLLGRGERGLQADHGQLPVGAADDGARRGRRHAARVRRDPRLREGARGLRPPDRPLPGDPPQVRRDVGQDRGRRRRSPTRRCASSPTARTRPAR